jgi:hypothetical protein
MIYQSHVKKEGRKEMSEFEKCPRIHQLKHGMPNYAGKRCGFLTVIGLWRPPNGHKNRSKRSQWIAKCDCVVYAIITSKAVNRASAQTACKSCQSAFQRKKVNVDVERR